jgi:O-antigen/teichoic acid export membrane protein
LKFSRLLYLSVPQLFNVVVQVFFNIAILVYLPTSIIGDYRLFLLYTSYLTFTNLGFYSGAIQKITSVSLNSNNVKLFESTILKFGFLNSVVNLVLSFFLFSNFLTLKFWGLYVCFIFLNPLIISADVILKFRQNFKGINLNVLFEILSSILIIGILVIKVSVTFFYFSLILRIVLFFLIRLRFFGIKSVIINFEWDSKFVYNSIQSGLKIMFFGYLLSNLFSNWDQFTIGKLHGTALLGIYSLQVFICGLALAAIASLDTILYPKSLNFYSTYNFSEIKSLYKKSLIFIFIALLITSFLFYFFRAYIYELRPEFKQLDKTLNLFLFSLPSYSLFVLTSFFVVFRRINEIIILIIILTGILYAYTNWFSYLYILSIEEIILAKYLSFLILFLFLLFQFKKINLPLNIN